MADATKLPALTFFSWSRPDAPNPRLAAPIDATSTTLTFTSAPEDKDGNVITGNFLMNCTNEAGYTELIYVPAGKMSTDGLTATDVIRGVRITGLDYTTGDPDFADVHEGDSPVGCAVNAVYQAILAGVLTGTIATNGVNLRLGTEADATVTLVAAGVTDKGFLRRNHSTNKVQFSNDGSSWTNIDDVTASDLIKVSVADTTPGYLDDKITVSGSGVTVTKSITSPGGDEKLNIDIVNLTADTAVDTPYTAEEDIALGAPVSKTTVDDEVENMVISTLATAGAESTFSATGTNTAIRSCYASLNKVAVIYSNATLGYLVIGTVGLTKAITWGTPVSLGVNVGSTDIKYMEDDKVVMSYRNVSDSKVYARVATINGLVPTLGTAKEIGDQDATAVGNSAVCVVDTDKIIVAFRDTSDSNKGKARCATVSGTTVSDFGTAIEILTTGAGNEVDNLAIAKSSTDKAVVFCRNVTDTNKGKGALIVATGTTLAANTEVEIDADASTRFSADYITDGKVLVTWAGGASGYVQARVASVSGLVLSYPTPVLAVSSVVPDDARMNSSCVLNATTAYSVYPDNAADGKFHKISISGTTLSLGTANGFNGGTDNVGNTVVAKVNAKGGILIAYKDVADSNKGNAEVFQEYDNSASLVGFATSTVLTGASVNARSKGVIDGQSGLVAGSNYYISSTGTLSTTNTAGIKVGTAKNATELDVDIDKDNGLSKDNADTLTDGSNADSLHTHVTSASDVQATGAISASGNTDLVITCGFEPTTIELCWGYVIPGTNTGLYYGKMVFNETTKKYSQAIAAANFSGMTWNTAQFGAICLIGSNYTLASDSTDKWSVLVSVLSVSSTGFTVRLAATKTNSPGNFSTSFGWIAYK